MMLRRQLKRLGLDRDAPPSRSQWERFLELVERAYAEAAQDRYTLERSLMISSTEMQVLNDSVRASERNFRALVERFPDLLFVYEGEIALKYANPAMVERLGYASPRELLGASYLEFVHPDDLGRLADYRRRRALGHDVGPLEIRWRKRTGEVVYVEAIAVPITFDSRDAMLVMARDVTVQRRAEERYRVVFERSPRPFLVYHRASKRILDANDAAASTYGYAREELRALTIRDLEAPRDGDPESTPAHGAQLRRHVRRDGVVIEVDMVTHPIMLADEEAVLAICDDVTDARRREERARQSQKLEALGRLAGGIAHDFNNILAVVLADCEYVREEMGETHPLASELREIQSAALRGAALTRQLLAFSRKHVAEQCVVALNAVVAELDHMLRRIIGEDVALHVKLDPTLGSIMVDPGLLEQTIMNLVVNARDAMPRGGTLVIGTGNVADGAALGLEPGPYVELIVTDTGVGMDEATLARIFEPFFTTKERGKGTGLGLATVIGIVEQAGGAVRVSSHPGSGSTFRVYFPRVDARVRSSIAPPPVTSAATAGARVLVAEDEADLRRAVSRLLRGRGYEVAEASSAQEALDQVQAGGRRFDLLLTDVVMPGFDGHALAEALRTSCPGLRVLFMSGYTEHDALSQTARSPEHALLQKPFTSDQLMVAVHAALSDVRAPRRPGSGDRVARAVAKADA